MVKKKGEKVCSMLKSNEYSGNKPRNNRVSSFLVFNFPDTWSRVDFKRVFKNYGALKNVYLARKKLSSGQRFGFIRFEGIRDDDCFVKALNSIQINGRWIRAFKAIDRKMEGSSHSKNDGEGTANHSKNNGEGVLNNDFPAPTWNHSSKSINWEGRSFVETLRGNNNQNTKDLPVPINNLIEIKVGGKCFEFNLPNSVSNHNLVFSYNNERFSWSLVEVNNKTLDVVERDGLKNVVEDSGSPGKESFLFDGNKGTCDDGNNIKSPTSSSVSSPVTDFGEGEVLSVKSHGVGAMDPALNMFSGVDPMMEEAQSNMCDSDINTCINFAKSNDGLFPTHDKPFECSKVACEMNYFNNNGNGNIMGPCEESDSTCDQLFEYPKVTSGKMDGVTNNEDILVGPDGKHDVPTHLSSFDGGIVNMKQSKSFGASESILEEFG